MKQRIITVLAAVLACANLLTAQTTPLSQMEKLARSIIALPADDGGQFVSWRMLGTDPLTTTFDLLRDGQPIATNLRDRTNFIDKDGTNESLYQVVVKVNGKVTETTTATKPWNDCYKVLQLDRPQGGTISSYKNDDGNLVDTTYVYMPKDASVGDVDGDGEYELFIIWGTNLTSSANNQDWAGNVYIDCYRLDGTRLWRIDMGINSTERHASIMVYDFDRDGKAELMLKTAPGTTDGTGQYVNRVATDAEILSANNTKDWRNKDRKVVGGQEYLTVFRGLTGEAIHTIFYNPNRNAGYGGEADGSFNWDDRPGRSDKANYGHRGNQLLGCVAWLDGPDSNPSVVMTRGIYTYVYLWAVDFDGSHLKHKWLHASVSKDEVVHTDAQWNVTSRTYSTNTFGTSNVYTAYGQGNHNLSVADVDGDGCDEIVYGAATIDNDGWLLYSTGLGHGDAIHVADIMPDRPGLEVLRCCENKPYGLEIHDAATGDSIFHVTANDDTGRCLAADIMGDYRGMEFWGAQNNRPRETATGLFNTVSSTMPSVNYRIYWDGDLLEELFDGSLDTKTGISQPNITKWNGTGFTRTMIDYNGSQTCNWTKATPLLQADIMGDWREELIMWNLNDPSQINIIATNKPSNYRVPTLMHDHLYRLGVAWQNVSYNQPPHLGYYLPDADFSNPDDTEDKPYQTIDLLTLDFETGEAADYWALNNEGSYLVEPQAGGSTGRAASIKASKDRGDYVKTDVDLNNVSQYTVETDLLPQRTTKTTQFAVLSQSSWSKWTNNYGIFWKNSTEQQHNATLFNWSADGNSTTALINIDYTGVSDVSWTFTPNVWYHLTLNIDVTGRTVAYTIAPKASPTEVELSGTYTLPDGESPLIKGIYERCGRYMYDPGAIAIDNVVVSTEVYDETPVTGDVNGDGVVNIADVAAVLNIMAGNTTGDGDVNGDGAVNIADVAAVLNIMAGN